MTVIINGSTGIDKVQPSASAGQVLELNGITFPATQVASANANTLDDYEEGTWTPAMTGTGVTYSLAQGSYVKIGRFVQFQLYIGLTGGTVGSTVTGLPFAAANIDRASYGMNVGLYIGNNGITFPSGKTYATCYVTKGGTTISVEASGSGSASASVSVANTSDFYIGGTYIAAS